MKASDIVKQLATEIPKHTDAFTNSIGILSIVPTGASALVETSGAHLLEENQNISIIGTKTPVEIDTASFLRTGTTAFFNTIQDHDLTLSDTDVSNGGKTITISGANEPEFNGTFYISRVVSRNAVEIFVEDAGPTTITGAPIVENGGVDTFNGWFKATGVTADTFTIALPRVAVLPAIVTEAKAQTSIRIAAVLDVVQYLTDVYTAEGLTEDQLIIQLGDVTTSKRRDEQTDATGSSYANYAHTPILIQPFSVYIIQNVTNQLAAATARDLVESTYVPAVMRSLERVTFDTGFSYNYGQVTFTAHGVYAYADDTGLNKAIYVHEMTFEQLARLTKDDAYDSNVSIAMRDIEYTFTSGIGTGIETMTANVNLDKGL